MGTRIFVSTHLQRLQKMCAPLNQFPSSPRPCMSSGHCIHYKLMASGIPVMSPVWGHWGKTDIVNMDGNLDKIVWTMAYCWIWLMAFYTYIHLTIILMLQNHLSNKIVQLIDKIRSRNYAIISITAFVTNLPLNLNQNLPAVYFLKISKHVYPVVLY